MLGGGGAGLVEEVVISQVLLGGCVLGGALTSGTVEAGGGGRGGWKVTRRVEVEHRQGVVEGREEVEEGGAGGAGGGGGRSSVSPCRTPGQTALFLKFSFTQ